MADFTHAGISCATAHVQGGGQRARARELPCILVPPVWVAASGGLYPVLHHGYKRVRPSVQGDARLAHGGGSVGVTGAALQHAGGTGAAPQGAGGEEGCRHGGAGTRGGPCPAQPGCVRRWDSIRGEIECWEEAQNLRMAEGREGTRGQAPPHGR